MHDLIIQRPARLEGQRANLLLLFHGVGSDARNLQSLGAAIAARAPQAWVVSVQSPDPCDLGQGWQWFSVRGVTEDNRAYRVATAMPGFVEAVARWQRESGVDASGTTLIGFSQGAIMALESTQLATAPAARVVAMAGRFASPPQQAPVGTRIHLLHGTADGVMPSAGSIEAREQWAGLHGQATLDLFPGLGHGIDARMVARLQDHLAAVE